MHANCQGHRDPEVKGQGLSTKSHGNQAVLLLEHEHVHTRERYSVTYATNYFNHASAAAGVGTIVIIYRYDKK